MSHAHHSHAKLPRGTVTLPAAAIGAMSLVLAVGLQALRLLDRIDGALMGWIHSLGLGEQTVTLPAWIGWLMALAIGFLLPLAILETPANWRRVVLWLSTLVIVAGLWPVLALAARWWPQAPVLVAVLWGGLCSMVYAARHQMPCEGGDAGRRLKSQYPR